MKELLSLSTLSRERTPNARVFISAVGRAPSATPITSVAAATVRFAPSSETAVTLLKVSVLNPEIA